MPDRVCRCACADVTVAGENSYCYPISFLERQKFIQILHDTLKGKDRVFTGKKVVCVEDGKSKALVKTADGTEYMADLVVGADGVHSIVRSEIFRQLQAASLIPRGEAENTGRFISHLREID